MRALVSLLVIVGSMLIGAAAAGTWYEHYRTRSAIVCKLNDGREVEPAKFIQAHGAFASSTGVCTVRK